jgi:glycosyltransferase involved in cell wall biosynthesis
MSINRNVANALTKSGRHVRHIRFLASQVGFKVIHRKYELPDTSLPYSYTEKRKLPSKAIDILANNSSHPLRVVSYFGIFAGLLNITYAFYVVLINISKEDIEKGWTTTSLQSSIMFFLLFIILAILSEYIGKILVESRKEPPYNIINELSSTISLADETRRNVTK